jgi:hypothetical protein
MDLSPENRLLVNCVQAGISETAANEMKEILDLPIQWEEFLKSAFWHGVAPLVFANLKDMPEARLVPPEVMEQLKEAYYATLARNVLLYSQLDKVLKSCKEERIEVLLLKGVALAKTVYTDIGMRPMGDIDIMVRREDLFKAEERLSALGYLFHGGNSPEWWRENYCHIGYLQPDTSVMIELHWHITAKTDVERIHNPDFVVSEALWGRAYHGEPFMDNVRVMSPEDALHHLCIHFLKHRFPYDNNGIFTSRGALRQISDIVYLLKQYENELDRKTSAQGEGLRRDNDLVAFVVSLIRSIAGNESMAACMNNHYKTGSADHAVLEVMAKKIFIRDVTRPDGARFAIDALSEVTFRDKAKKIFGAVFPSPEVLSERYAVPVSSKGLYLYYFKRPFDLFLKHRKIMSEIPRMKDDVILNRWIHGQDDNMNKPAGRT